MRPGSRLLSICAVIPAQGGPKSIPSKNLVDFCGKPLIAWSINQARQSSIANRVYVVTDDVAVASVAQTAGAKIIWSPAEPVTDTASPEDALLCALSEIEKEIKVDIALLLQATSPLREEYDIDNAIHSLVSAKADSLFSAAVLEGFRIWRKDQDAIKRLSFDQRNRGRCQYRNPYYLENGSIYLFKPEVLRRHHNRLGGNTVMYEMAMWKSLEVDNPEDLELCTYYMRKRILRQDDRGRLPKDIKLMVYDFDGVMTDNTVLVREDGVESVFVSRADGLGIGRLRKAGFKQLILSTETNRVVSARAKKLRIEVLQGSEDKTRELADYCQSQGIDLAKVLYIGNDVNDLEAMGLVGYPVAPADAHPQVLAIAKYVTRARGGEGVIKEVSEALLSPADSLSPATDKEDAHVHLYHRRNRNQS